MAAKHCRAQNANVYSQHLYERTTFGNGEPHAFANLHEPDGKKNPYTRIAPFRTKLPKCQKLRLGRVERGGLFRFIVSLSGGERIVYHVILRALVP